ncbi:hypothetical protein [Acidovorax sp.]|uniref:hypothetical protein n=1 Tax=Acidovorax sp. TaxID=1872122 RepID=UPI0031D24331
MSEALIAPTYSEAYELRRQFRQLYGAGAALDYLFATVPPTGAQLEAWLATDANLTAFQRTISTQVGASTVCAGGAAVAAVVGSATALAYMRDSDTGRAAMLNAKTAMTAVLGSATACGALLTSSAFRGALYDNETAWALWVASANGRNALSAIAAEHANATSTHVSPAGIGTGTRVMLVQQKATGTTQTSYAGSNADTYTTSSLAYIDRYVRVPGLTHRSAGASSTSWIRYVIV